jgi:nitrate reductase gamma subunit
LASTLGSIGTARVTALSTVQVEREKTKKVVTVAVIAGVLLVVGLVVILKKR